MPSKYERIEEDMQHPAINVEELKSFAGVTDSEDILFFLRTFRREFLTLILKCHQCVSAKDRDGLKKIAHTAKGAANSIQANPLKQRVKEIEDSTHEYGWDELTFKIGRLFQSYQEVQEFIDGYIIEHHLFSSIWNKDCKIILLDEEGFFSSVLTNQADRLGIPNIITANSIDETVTIANREQTAIPLLISTCFMPDLQGLRMTKSIREGIDGLANDLPILLIIGDQEGQYLQTMIELDIQGLLPPKYRSNDLVKYLLRTLDYLKVKDQWIKSPGKYRNIDIPDRTREWMEGVLNRPKENANISIQNSNEINYPDTSLCFHRLTHNIEDRNGNVILPAQHILTIQNLYLLNDLHKSGLLSDGL